METDNLNELIKSINNRIDELPSYEDHGRLFELNCELEREIKHSKPSAFGAGVAATGMILLLGMYFIE